MSNNKTLKVFSSTAVAGMIAAAMMSSQAFAAVDAYSVKVGDQVYKYDRVQLEKSFLDAKAGDKAALYEDFTKKLGEAKGFYAFNDTKNGYVDYKSIEAKFLESKDAGKAFDVNAFTESKDAKVLEVKAVKKAVVNKDGSVEYKEETSEVDPNAEVQVTSVEALNLKQVKINFAKAVTSQDKIDDIEDEDNYNIYNKDDNEVKDIIDKVEVDKSGKFAILTFSDKKFFENKKYKAPTDRDYGIINQEKYKIEFDSNITGEELKKTVEFNDFHMPEVTSIKVVGSDSIKIKFTEPVRPYEMDNNVPCLDDDDIEINDGDISIDKIELSDDNMAATIKVGDTLKDGSKLKVKVQGSIHDYAGYGVKAKTDENVVVKKDSSKPQVVGYKDVKKGKVTLVFDKDIKFENTDEKMQGFDGLKKEQVFEENGDIQAWSKIADTVEKHRSDEFYHTNDTNGAYAAKIDGKELTLYFNEDKYGINKGTCYINIKSDKLESLWDVKNNKIYTPVERNIDETKLEVKSVKQDDDNGKKIKVKFNKNIDQDTAEKSSNYTLKDEDGDKWNIQKVEKTDSKEITITTSKKLDSTKYKLTIKDVEDEDGNEIEKITKEFTATQKDAVKNDDLTINLYNQGKNDQKIIVDFDTKMKTKGDNNVKDPTKYTLVAGNATLDEHHNVTKFEEVKAFDNHKSTVQVSKMYNENIKCIEQDKKVEIKVPYKKDKDDSYDFSKYYEKTDGSFIKVEEFNGKDDELKNKDSVYYINGQKFNALKVVVGRVADADDNINALELSDIVDKKGKGYVDIKKKDGDLLVRAISTNEVQVTFKDKIDFKNKDIELYAINTDNEKDALEAIKAYRENNKTKNNELQPVEISGWGNNPESGKTVVTMTLDKNQAGSLDKEYDDSKNKHVLSYNGQFNKKNLFFTTVSKTKSKNSYDAKVRPNICVKVRDNIAPALVDNSKRDDKYKYAGNNVYLTGEDEKVPAGSTFSNLAAIKDNEDKAVEYKTISENEAEVVLTFEENIAKTSLSDRNTFKLDTNSDYKMLRIKKVYRDENKHNKIRIQIEGLKDLKPDVTFGQGFEIIQNGPIADESQVNKGQGNEITGISTQIGNFADLAKPEAEAEVNAAIQKVLEAKAKTADELLAALKSDKLGLKNITDANKDAYKAKLDGKVDVTTVDNIQNNVIDAVNTEVEAAAKEAEIKAANKAISEAKDLLVDKTLNSGDTNLVTVLNAIKDMDTKGVTLAVKAEVKGTAEIATAKIAKDGAITKGTTQQVINVVITIAKDKGTTIEKTIAVTIPKA